MKVVVVVVVVVFFILKKIIKVGYCHPATPLKPTCRYDSFNFNTNSQCFLSGSQSGYLSLLGPASFWQRFKRFVGRTFATPLLSDALPAILSWCPCVRTLYWLYFRDYHASVAVIAPFLDLSLFLMVQKVRLEWFLSLLLASHRVPHGVILIPLGDIFA